MAGPDPDAPVAIDGQSMTGDPDAPVHVGEAQQEAAHPDPDAPTAVNGVSTSGPAQKGFFAEFAGPHGLNGWLGIPKAWFTESIPAEMIKAPFSSDENRATFKKGVEQIGGLTGGYAMLAKKKIDDFLATPESKDLPELAKQAYHDTVKAFHDNPGAATGSLIKGVATDPELFWLPGATEARGAAAAVRVAEAAGAGEKGAAIAAKVGAKATATATGAAIGGGSEFAHEIGDDTPLNPGALAISTGIGAVAGAAAQVHGKGGPKIREMTPEEIDAQIEPYMAGETGTTPEIHVEPSADGYTVRAQGQDVQITYPTKAEAEAASIKIRDQASAYRVMGTVPRGTPNAAGARARMMIDNPFTPENMAKWVKRAGISVSDASKNLTQYWTKAAVAMGFGAGAGAALDDQNREGGALFGAAITAIPRMLPADKRIQIDDVINERNGQIAVWARHTLQFKSAIDGEIPEPQRRYAVSRFLEGTDPGIKLNDKELAVAKSVREFFNLMGETAVDAGVMKEMLHDYVSHIVVEKPGGQQGSTIDKLIDVLVGNNSRPEQAGGRQFAKHRRYTTFDELQTALKGSNLQIKTGDIGEIMAIYSKAMFRAVTDKRLLTALKQVQVDEMPPLVIRAADYAKDVANRILRRDRQIGQEPIDAEFKETDPKLARPPGTDVSTSNEGGPPATTGSPGEPPTGDGKFKLPDAPPPGEAAQRHAAHGPRTLVMDSDREDASYTQLNNRQLAGVVVHKDIAAQLSFVFQARDPIDITLGLMALNQASKRAIVSFSLFHAKSLTDAFIGDQGLKARSGKQRVMDALAMFRYGGDDGWIDHVLKGGLQIQVADDNVAGAMDGALARTAEVLDKALPVTAVGKAVVKGAAGAAKAVAKFNDVLDHFTFKTLQNGFKLVTASDAFERLVKKGIPPDKAGQMAASYANDIYGSLDWFRVANEVHSKWGRTAVQGFFNPSGRRYMQLLMFAPDWTLSTFRAAYKALPGAVDDPALAALHRRYLAKSALYYLTVGNALNYALAGHSIFANQNPTRIQLKDGRTMQYSKHFMEPFEWLRDPVQTADNKLGFLPRTGIEIGTGKEYVSAHDTAPDIDAMANMVANQFLPINMQQGKMGGGAASAMGLIGMPIYGKTPDQAREAKKDKKIANREKRKKQAEYFRSLHKND